MGQGLTAILAKLCASRTIPSARAAKNRRRWLLDDNEWQIVVNERPNQSGNPTDASPSSKKIEHKNRRRTSFPPSDNAG